MSKRKKSGFRLFIVMGLMLYFTYIILDQQKVMNAKSLELKNIDDKIRQEMKVNAELKKQKEEINTDEYTEKIAREKLGMVKHGEKIFVDIDK